MASNPTIVFPEPGVVGIENRSIPDLQHSEVLYRKHLLSHQYRD